MTRVLPSHLCEFDSLELLLCCCEWCRPRAGGHVALVALQADVVLVTTANGRPFRKWIETAYK